MGRDKALITYHGIQQFLYAAQLLETVCEQVYISCRPDQSIVFKNIPAAANFPLIIDHPDFGDIGPLNGVLSAFSTQKTAWFVLGCDYPLLQTNDLYQLIEARQTDKAATVFKMESGILEPLIGIYETQTGELLLNWLAQGNQSLRHFLDHYKAHWVTPKYPEHLISFDHPGQIFTKFNPNDAFLSDSRRL
jgi:molybdopterin-guanine dinucleotide biosynthesis protein A